MTQDGKTVVADGTVRLIVLCPICASYARLRGARIRNEIHRTVPPADRYATWVRFMAGVHARHLAPGRIARRTPITNLEETR